MSWPLRLWAPRFMRLMAFERHRANNQLQVLSGWIALGRAEKAAQYLEQLVEEERMRAATLHALPAWAQLTLAELWAAAERADVELTMDVEPGARPRWRVVLVAVERLVRIAGGGMVRRTIRVRVRGSGVVVEVTGQRLDDLATQSRLRPWRVDGESAIWSRGWQEGSTDVRR